MYTTTAMVALGEHVVAPCPHCGCIVLVRQQQAESSASRGGLPEGTGKCRGCGEPLAVASIRIPGSCWQERFESHPSMIDAA